MKNKKYDALFILVRGLGRESKHWGDFPEQLESKAPHILVKCVDLPGTGENLAMSSPMTMRGLSEFVRSEAEYTKTKMKLGAIKTFILAPSLGGMIAVDWMANYPKDLSGAILINTSFGSWSAFWQRLQPQSYRHILQIVLKEKDALARESEVVKMVSNDRGMFSTHARKWAKVFAARPIHISTILRQLLAARDFAPSRLKLGAPILLLNSAQDHMVNPQCSDVIQKTWDCPMFTHPWAGHDIPLDDPNWVIEKTVLWYESLVAPNFKAASAQN